MTLKAFVIASCLLPLASSSIFAKVWRGIEPYHSSRADVERLLGPPNFNGWLYDFPDERVLITYSNGACNVPKDIVVEISISFGSLKPLAEVLIPGKEYEKIQAAHTPHIYYLDSVEGLKYTVSEGMVQGTTYLAAAKDQKLLCGENKFAAPVAEGVKLNSIEHYPFDSFGNLPFEDVKTRLDNFVIQLFNLKAGDSRWRGYIIVYAGRRAYRGEAKFKSDCAKDYLVRIRKIDPESVIAADGGFRDEMSVELFLGRTEYYPPRLNPTVSLKNAQIINRSPQSCTELSPNHASNKRMQRTRR